MSAAVVVDARSQKETVTSTTVIDAKSPNEKSTTVKSKALFDLESDLRSKFKEQEQAYEGMAGAALAFLQTGKLTSPILIVHEEGKIWMHLTERNEDDSYPQNLTIAIASTPELKELSDLLADCVAILDLVPVCRGSDDCRGRLFDTPTHSIIRMEAHHVEYYQSKFCYFLRNKATKHVSNVNFIATSHISDTGLSANYIPICIKRVDPMLNANILEVARPLMKAADFPI